MHSHTRIETRESFDLMGVALYGNPRMVRFHDAWVHFGTVADELDLPRTGRDLYGLQIYPPAFPSVFEFTYMAGIERLPHADVPIRMLMKHIPASTYVVHSVEGGVRGIDPALEYLYKQYIPAERLTVAWPFDFEKYCAVQSADRVAGSIEVWIPIVE